MPKEEIMKMRESMQIGVKMMLQEVEEFVRHRKDFSIYDIMNLADIMKDMSEVDKNIAKANYYDRRVN